MLLDYLQISPIFTDVDLYDFHGFDGENDKATTKEWVNQLPKKPREVIEVLDMKEAHS